MKGVKKKGFWTPKKKRLWVPCRLESYLSSNEQDVLTTCRCSCYPLPLIGGVKKADAPGPEKKAAAIDELKKTDPARPVIHVWVLALWAILTDAWNYSAHLFPVHLQTAGKYLYGYASRIIWMFPAFILISRFDQNLLWNRKQLFSKPKAEPVFIIFIAMAMVYALAAMAVNYRSWHITDENLLFLTVKLLIVGIGEEIVFR